MLLLALWSGDMEINVNGSFTRTSVAASQKPNFLTGMVEEPRFSIRRRKVNNRFKCCFMRAAILYLFIWSGVAK